MQRPDRRPASVAIADSPRGEPLGPGALAAPEDLGGQTEQPQGGVGALNGADGVTGIAGKAFVGGSTVAAGAPVGVAGAGLGDAHQGPQ